MNSDKRTTQFVIAVVLVFVIEFLIMLLINYVFPPMPKLLESIVDASILVVTLYPILYILHIRPLQRLRADEQKKSDVMTQKLSAAIEQTADIVIITDKDGIIEYVNPTFEDVTGYKRKEIIGKMPSILKSGKHNIGFYENLWRTILSGEHYRDTFINMRKDGTLYYEEKTITPIKNEKGDVTHFISTGKDVTGRKKTEDELMKMDRLESLGLLAGGIAHDFNNILTAIIGNISIAKIDVKDERVFRLLGEAEKASLRAKDLTHQLLTFSKGGTPVKKLSSISKLVEESASFALRGSNIRCEFSIPDGIWPVEIDEGQINQVINNIVINAQQAMPSGGTIGIKCDNVTIGKKDNIPIQHREYVLITIVDTGIGISKEYIHKIFDPYFTTKQRGSGLGLATSYSIIRNHNGHITVDSKTGVGSAFYIYIPASPNAVIPEEYTREGVVMGKGRVLIMDDEMVIRDVASEMLKNVGYEVETAKDGEEAIELYKRAKDSDRPFDAVIMDLTIPGGMGGKDAIKELIELDPAAKVIVSSGYSNDPIVANFREYGFKGVVAKPYKIEEMSRTLSEVVKGTIVSS
ncbi:MAG: hypothetical protein A2W23_04625 [Planctomycetes bacterium RBG_16_43_13]|nr:MAG: hypothetical protein A2W23_04625 [Planctomycetes bacterium RBG_16_43_13]